MSIHADDYHGGLRIFGELILELYCVGTGVDIVYVCLKEV